MAEFLNTIELVKEQPLVEFGTNLYAPMAIEQYQTDQYQIDQNGIVLF